MQQWSSERADDLAALVELVLPAEALSADELLACCWDPGWEASTVLALPGGEGAVAVAARPVGDRLEATVSLLAVEPAASGEGRGRRLLDAACEWASDAGAAAVHAGGLGPWYLWPGIDVRWTRALVLAEAAGFVPTGAALNLSCPTTLRVAEPEDVAVRRVLDDADVEAVLTFVAGTFAATSWAVEAARAIDHGCCHAAFDATGRPLGFACHSVSRAGWIGPMGVDPAARGHGVGAALLAAACRDLRIADLGDAEISWIGPVGFYARVAGAAVSRVFRTAVWRR